MESTDKTEERFTKIERQLKRVQASQENLKRRLFALTTRDAVCTEVSRVYPELSRALHLLRDEDDGFWNSRKSWSIDDWARHVRLHMQ